ncbi:MAG: mannose-6-phosphate isomerase, class I [Ilumatobacteraceae bacterium]
MQPITGVVQHYAWGDREFIPRLLGVEPDGRPWAELWLGTHANGPATLPDGRPLADVTGPLPFLLKVLAAAEPLSLQTHPSRQQAEAGFAAGRYPDPEPKPELLVALTPFDALCGVRPVDATIDLLDELGAADLAAALRRHGPGGAMASLYRGGIKVGPIVDAAAGSDREEARCVTALAERYPGDPSVAATLLLNRVHLQPGEAIVLGPGNLHAYLGGAGIELMGPSDNVVRGGLTAKAVDVDDLLAVFDATPLADPVLTVGRDLTLPGTSIHLDVVAGEGDHTAAGHEIVVTSTGQTGHLAPGTTLTVAAGTTAYVASG